MNHGKFPFSSVVVVVLLGCLAGVVAVLRLLSYTIHSNTYFCKFGLYSCEGSSCKFQSSLALFVASFFFFLVRARWQRLEQERPFAVSATNGVPQHSQFRVTGRMGWPP